MMKLLADNRFQGYSLRQLQKDLMAGLIVGIVAIPLALAFAIASGVKPEYGLYTAIIAGFLTSLLGGSRFAISGPTGAFIPVLFAIVMQYGYENLLIAGFMAGVILVLMGLFRMGAIIQYFPKPVTIGFTAGIAVIIFSGQIADFFGLKDVQKRELFHENMIEIAVALGTVNIFSLLTAVICLAVILLAARYLPKIPGALLGLLASTLVAAVFYPEQVATIGSKFGGIPNALPELQMPQLSVDKLTLLIGPALMIAMLGSIESLLCAVVADNMAGSKHNSNRELVGQGISNMVAPLFGGIPATGAIARTATNIRNGAVSPVSGMVHSVVLLAVLLVLAPLASKIPMASMAPILMFVAWNMSERKEFAHILKTKSFDTVIMLATFLLTVFIDLTTGVAAGLLISFILFVKQMKSAHSVSKVAADFIRNKVSSERLREGASCPQISMFTLEGPLFFAATQVLEESVEGDIRSGPKVILLRMSKVPYLDTSGEGVLANLAGRIQKHGGALLISGIRRQPKNLLRTTGLYEQIGSSRFFEHTGQAIDYALSLLDENKCKGCTKFAFRECPSLSGMEPRKPASEVRVKDRALSLDRS